MFAIRAAALSELADTRSSLDAAVKALSPARRARVVSSPKTLSPAKRSERLIDAPKQFYGPGIVDEHGKVRPDTSEDRAAAARDRSPRSQRAQVIFSGSDVKAGAKSVRSSRVAYPMPQSTEPVCHWCGTHAAAPPILSTSSPPRSPKALPRFRPARRDRHKINEEGRKGRQVVPLTCAVCNTTFCLQCVSNRFTSIDRAAADLAAWTADPFWVCFVCSGECNWCVRLMLLAGVCGRGARLRAPLLT